MRLGHNQLKGEESRYFCSHFVHGSYAPPGHPDRAVAPGDYVKAYCGAFLQRKADQFIWYDDDAILFPTLTPVVLCTACVLLKFAAAAASGEE